MERIGNVILDDVHYPGEDLYSDGAVEDHILDLVRSYPQEEYPQVIAREQDWAVMYHLSHERENILSWYPFAPGAKVLEVGSGCGAVTGAVSASAESVTCIDLSKKRSTINAERHRDSANITIRLGNFQDVEKDLDNDFDYATLIGVFEYGRGYIGGEKPYHGFLTTVMKHVRPGGKLLLAIENKFGLKYWAGCREDHVGAYFEGLEGYQNTKGVRTFTRPELIRIMEECGYHDYRFYYPYPDYKFPAVVYSDEYLPKAGELNRNICNFDRSRLVLMDEGKVYDQILESGLFPLYANSFFVEITKPQEADGQGSLAGHSQMEKQQERVLYTKYSSGRSKDFSIQTRIVRGMDGKNILYKKAEYPGGQAHIEHIAEAEQRLASLWQERGQLCVNRCHIREGRIEFEYLQGVTVEEELDELLAQGKTKEAADVLGAAIARIRESARAEGFQMSPEFEQVFGAAAISPGEPSFPVADVDLIFSNLLKTEDGNWHVLDYEWTFFFPVPVDFLLFRALHYYLETAPVRQEFGKKFDLYGRFGIAPDRQEIYLEMEKQFQKFVAGGSISPGSLYHTMGKMAIPLGELLAETDRRRVQVYLDYGNGFSEEDSYFIETGYDKVLQYAITIPENVVQVSIDPALSACLIKDLNLAWEHGDGKKEPASYRTNGYQLEKNVYLFDNSDPKIIIKEMPKQHCRLEISYTINILEEETAAILLGRAGTGGRIKKAIRRLIKG